MSALLDSLCGAERLANILANELAMEIPHHQPDFVLADTREQPAMEPSEEQL